MRLRRAIRSDHSEFQGSIYPLATDPTRAALFGGWRLEDIPAGKRKG